MLQCNTQISFKGHNMFKQIVITTLAFLLINVADAAPSQNSKIKVVAAENFYGELAKEIGGDSVDVQSIINNPNADPHLFTTSPSVSKALADAQVIIYNGANYDPWMDQMLKSLKKKKSVTIINVADLMGIKKGDNPHIWYKPETFPRLANKLADQFASLNKSSAQQINDNLFTFLDQNKKVLDKVTEIKIKYASVPVTATEPVYGYMADAMGLNMKGLDFQWKIMNDTEPTPQMLASYESMITGHKVNVLFYNDQVTDPATKNILALAQKNNIPVVGVTETMPLNATINPWLLGELNKTESALKIIK